MRAFILCILLYLPTQSFALSDYEAEDFYYRVSEMSKLKKGAAISTSLVGLAILCPSGAALTGLSAIADSLPFVGSIQSGFMDTDRQHMGSLRNKHRDAHEYSWEQEVNGGFITGVKDLIQLGVDSTDLRLDEEHLKDVKLVYLETQLVAEKAFGKSGYCIDQYDQLGILLGL